MKNNDESTETVKVPAAERLSHEIRGSPVMAMKNEGVSGRRGR
jgi:hypothetical protein